DHAGSQVDDGRGNEKRRDAAGAALDPFGVLALDDVEAANAGGDIDTGGVRDVGRDFQPGHAHREIRAGHGELNEAAHLFQLFFGDPDEWIEAVDLGGDAAIECGAIEMSDRADAALPGEQLWPNLVGANAQRTDQTYTR